MFKVIKCGEKLQSLSVLKVKFILQDKKAELWKSSPNFLPGVAWAKRML